MKNYKILNTRGKKEILAKVISQFGFNGKIEQTILLNKEDIFLISNSLAKVDTKNLRVNSLGLYFGNIKKGYLRVSIEGSQLIGNSCNKNILELDNEAIRYWLAGDDLKVETELLGYVLIKNKNDFLGCGYMKDGTLLNYIPKERRVIASKL